MKEAVTRSELQLEMMLRYISEHQKKGLPEPEAQKMRDAAQAVVKQLKSEVNAVTRFNSKLKDLVHLVASPEEIEAVSSEIVYT
jgi:hypothetical protein